ncbi:MAG: hypothetical protein PVF58_00040 [Candidatus Methanofastidiosia archaeon]
MKLITSFLSDVFFHKKRKRRKHRTSLFEKKVKKMKSYGEKEAKEKALELLELVISIHRETGTADCSTDTQMLEYIKKLLADLEAEERDILDTQFKLYKAYIQELHDIILYFVEINKETYIDFEEVPAILKRSESIMESDLSKLDDYRGIIQELSRKYKELRDNKSKLKKQGRNKFFKYLVTICGVVVGAFGTVAIFEGLRFSDLPAYLVMTLMITYLIFNRVYTKLLIVGYSEIFREHEYYEE